jgi:hypothetical protein
MPARIRTNVQCISLCLMVPGNKNSASTGGDKPLPYISLTA